MAAALGAFRVIDLSGSIAGQYCSRLFADFGANVVLAEPAGGSPVRRIGPFDEAGRSLTFFHLNFGKEIVDLPPSSDALSQLLENADVVVVPAGVAGEIQAVAADDCICVEVSSFGADGPYRDWKGSELVYQAISGMMANNGEGGREPLYGVGNRASYAAGVAAYISAATALYARARGAGGQVARADVAETAAAMCFPYVLQYAYNGTDRRRGDQEIPAGQVLCRGTWVCIWIYPHRFRALCETLRLESLPDDPRFANPAARARNWSALFDIIQEHLRNEDAEDVVRRLQEAQVIAACAYRPTELLNSPHLAARSYWEGFSDEAGDHLILGPPFRMSRTPRRRSAGNAIAGAAE
ncbi:CoA transferase [Chelativorans sp. AA-79]|uniref:CoA transferase n=1 Tax=Chelativorans sp. AA-79 TaxID=3028735 RepID=UPI0023F93970|nr:CoA transferase [Chelativorans sp. AA-79]WEX09107.1 CoA transferase [Chelativorans sp. AA-79]